MAKQPKDIAASVRQRLLNLARAEGQLFDVVLVAFGLERLVYRLSVSEYRNRFVLKGGMLVTLWTADTGRFTRDIDFLAFGSDEEAELKTAFSQILAIDGGAGLVYDVASLTAVAIREDQIYGGMRLRTDAYLGSTRIPITVDLGFGDAFLDGVLGQQVALDQVFHHEGVAELRGHVRQLANDVVGGHLDFRDADFVAVDDGDDLVVLRGRVFLRPGRHREAQSQQGGRGANSEKISRKRHASPPFKRPSTAPDATGRALLFVPQRRQE